MLKPGLTDLLEPIVIGRTAAHPIEILRNDRVIGLGQAKPIERLIAVIARGRTYCKADLRSVTSELFHGRQISHNDIRSWRNLRSHWSAAVPGRQDGGLECTVEDGFDFDRIHGNRDRNFADNQTNFRWSPKLGGKTS